jgi:hypothetical protein
VRVAVSKYVSGGMGLDNARTPCSGHTEHTGGTGDDTCVAVYAGYN